MKSNAVILGVGGHVVALDVTTGSELWRTKLKGSDFVTISIQDGRIYAGAKGEVFCLDSSGTILWHNNLKGLGLGLVAFDANQSGAAAEKIIAQRQAAAAAAST